MDKKSKFKFQVLVGVVIITAVVFLAFKYLMKGSPVIKVMAVGLVAGTAYLVVDYLIKKNKEL
jgi:hypothetical protein